MKPAPLVVVLLPLLFGGCEKKDPVAEVKAVEEKQKGVKAVDPNLKYEPEGDTITITDCDEGASGKLVIPAAIEGKSVTSIGREAFSQNISLKSVTIGDSVTSIGEHAFEDCHSLTSIMIPNSVTSIGEHAFQDCRGLKSVTIGDSVTSISSTCCRYLPNGVASTASPPSKLRQSNPTQTRSAI